MDKTADSDLWKSVAGWFGKAFIKINDTGIFVKKGVFKKEWELLWDNTRQIEYKVIKIEFTLKNVIKVDLDYDNLDFEHIQIIKRTIKTLSEEKKITLKNYSQ